MFREQNCKQTTELVFDVSIGILMTTTKEKKHIVAHVDQNMICTVLIVSRVMHQPVTRGSRDKGADVTETNVTSSGDTGGRGARDIEMPDSGNTQIGPGDDTKLEEMTQITCKIDNKVGYRVIKTRTLSLMPSPLPK